MTDFTLLTIIAEESLAQLIEQEIEELGAKGFTLTAVSGKSLGNTRDNPWEGENIKIETIVNAESSQKILNHLQQKYFDRYAIIAFTQPVRVVRSDHF